MTEFRAECIINLHVEALGSAKRAAWACSLVHDKRGRLLLARGLPPGASRVEAELEALVFGLRQAARLLQEKVELRAAFSLEDKVSADISGGRRGAGLLLKREEATRAWSAFRLRRVARIGGEETAFLRDAVRGAGTEPSRREG